VSQGICVDPVGAQVLQHAADDTFTRGDIAGQPDDILTRPLAHACSLMMVIGLILAVAVQNVKGLG
jgi:hypothetical protein